MVLRPYQEQAVAAVLNSYAQFDCSLLVAPTGSGKTIIFAHIAKRVAELDGGKTLILAHREELIDQAIDKLLLACDIRATKEKADSYADRTAQIVVASVQTLRSARLESWPKDHFAKVIVDEAHHVTADSYQRILAHFQGTRVLGVTATPDRGDKRSLGTYFQDVAYEINLLDLIRDRFLSPIKAETIPIKIDLSGVNLAKGDLDASGLGHAIAPYLEHIAGLFAERYKDRKTLVFLPLIKLSEQFALLCKTRGIAAEHIDGTTTERSEILERFSSGHTRLLSNAMLLTEGYDEPSIDCIVCLRPTRVRSLFAQIVGRGTRIHPGKSELLIVDFLWLSQEHNLIKPAHLVAADQREAADITRAMEEGSSLTEAKEVADEERRLELEREIVHRHALAAQLEANRHRKGRLFDAVELAIALRDLVNADYEPTMGWHTQTLTDKQATFLEHKGIDSATIKDRGHASSVISRIKERETLRLATPKQAFWLHKLGHPHPELCSFQEASQFLDNAWNKDRQVEPTVS
jgi:superfamily II DNA or RNA helicase